MDRLISIPREALAELLHAAGSVQSPEEFVAALPEVQNYKKYPGRALVSASSKYVLLVIAVLAGVCLPFGFSIEAVVIVAGLAAVTYFEFQVSRAFRAWDPRAPTLGFCNQSAFAAALLIYGLYHAIISTQLQLPADDQGALDPSTLGMVQVAERIFYLIVGVVGGVSQFALALYYRMARVRPANTNNPG